MSTTDSQSPSPAYPTSPFSVGQSVYILNSHRNRANLGLVTDIDPATRTMSVLNTEKGAGAPFLYDAVGGEAIGAGYNWVSGAVRARVVPLEDAEAVSIRSLTEKVAASNRRYDAIVAAAAAMKAAQLMEDSTPADRLVAFSALEDAVDGWWDDLGLGDPSGS